MTPAVTLTKGGSLGDTRKILSSRELLSLLLDSDTGNLISDTENLDIDTDNDSSDNDENVIQMRSLDFSHIRNKKL